MSAPPEKIVPEFNIPFFRSDSSKDILDANAGIWRNDELRTVFHHAIKQLHDTNDYDMHIRFWPEDDRITVSFAEDSGARSAVRLNEWLSFKLNGSGVPVALDLHDAATVAAKKELCQVDNMRNAAEAWFLSASKKGPEYGFFVGLGKQVKQMREGVQYLFELGMKASA